MNHGVAERIARLSPEQRAVLEKRLLDARQAAIPAPAPRDPNTPVPLSSPQARLWLIQQLDPAMILFNAPGVWRMQGTLNLAAVQFALDTIVTRHAALRTGIQVVNGQPAQIVHPTRPVELFVHDLRGMDAAQRDGEVQQIVQALVQRPFDLARDVLVRAAVIQVAPAEFLLCTSRHHIANDAWSVVIYGREFAECYRAFVTGEPPQLPVLRADYADFALRQNERMQGAWFDREMDYWRTQLADIPNLELPTDHPRPPRLTYRGEQVTIELDGELVESLRDLARREGVTFFMLMLTSFEILLGRYAGQADFAVGTNILGRDRVEYENLIGYFANVLALRANLAGNPTCRELVQRTRQTVLDAFAHSQVPFEKLIWDLRRTRDESRTPLFQVLFQVTQMDFRMNGLPGIQARSVFFDPRSSEYDISLDLRDLPTGMQCAFRYSTDLFDRATIERMAGHYQTLLRDIVRQPDAHINALHFLSETERKRLLVEWNQTQSAFPRERCIHELVAAQASKTPNALAAVCENQTMTYRELDARANQFARYLQKRGVGPDIPVAIFLERSLDMLVAILGVLKAGGTYLPLEPDIPAARLAIILEQAHAALLISSSALVPTLPALTLTRILIDEDGECISQERDTPPQTAVTSEHLAYVIYTSGTTGQPKGVMVEHHSLVNHATFFARYYQLAAHDRVLQFAPIAFDFAAEEIFPAWLSGSSVVVRPQDTALVPNEFLEFVTAHQLTVLDLPTAFWHTLGRAMDELDLTLPGCVRLVIVGGEKVEAQAFVRWRSRVGDAVRWVNTYGPTEATIAVATFEQRADTGTPHNIPIGQPIANTQLFILDAQLNPEPPGVTGDLYISGEPLARGYLNQPELTASSFIPNPYASFFTNAPTLYRTGDRARFRGDGQIEFRGRLDDQVKLRGFRIELGEIQTALAGHPLVERCAVMVQERSANQRLVAYVVAREQAPAANELRAWLGSRLPEYMLPGAFVFLDALPLTSHGKVDRHALPAPESFKTQPSDEFIAPQTPQQELVAKIWADVLDVPRVGLHDNFFERGGHSLLAALVVTRAQAELGQTISLRSLFDHPTLEQWVRLLERDRIPAPPPLVRVARERYRRTASVRE